MLSFVRSFACTPDYSNYNFEVLVMLPLLATGTVLSYLWIAGIAAYVDSDAPAKPQLTRRVLWNTALLATFFGGMISGFFGSLFDIAEEFAGLALILGTFVLYRLDRKRLDRAFRELHWTRLAAGRRAKRRFPDSPSSMPDLSVYRRSAAERYGRAATIASALLAILIAVGVMIEKSFESLRDPSTAAFGSIWFLSAIVHTWLEAGPQEFRINVAEIRMVDRQGDAHRIPLDEIQFVEIHRNQVDLCTSRTDGSLKLFNIQKGGIRSNDWCSMIEAIHATGLVID